MLTLILMRHAKSSWGDPSLDDHDRPLNARGRSSAEALGAWLREKHFLPDRALVSTAARTQETFMRLALKCPADYVPALYHASASQMMQVLQRVKGNTVLMVGHNPGIAQFAGQLAETLPTHPRFYDYPTCATWVAKFETTSWDGLDWRSGKTLDFVIPRELIG